MKDKLERVFGKDNVIVHESKEDTTYIIFGHDKRTVKASIIVDKKYGGEIWHVEFNGTYRDFLELGFILEDENNEEL